MGTLRGGRRYHGILPTILGPIVRSTMEARRVVVNLGPAQRSRQRGSRRSPRNSVPVFEPHRVPSAACSAASQSKDLLPGALPLDKVPNMIREVPRYASAMGLAGCLWHAFLPFGCGGGGLDHVQHASAGAGIPDATLAELKACAEQAKERLKGTYAFEFDFRASENGRADRVKLKDASPDDGGVASCMVDAIEGMRVPPSVLVALLADAESKAEAAAASPGARGLIANPLVLVVGGGIAIVDTIAIAATATVVVAISISLVQDVVETISKRRKFEKMCEGPRQECLDNRKQPEWNRKKYGEYKDCGACFRDCKNHSDGKWPEDKCPRSN